jgi:hypothetical protein
MNFVNRWNHRLEFATSRPAHVLLYLLMFAWFFVDVGPRARVNRPQHRTDVTVYTEAGAAFFDGREPYEVTNVRGWHYLYPPMFALAMAPLSLLDTYWQAFVWFSVSVVLCGGCFHECKRLLQILIPEGSEHIAMRPIIGLIAWLTAFFPFVNTMQRGQVGIALLYPLLLGFRLVLQNRNRRGLLAGGLFLSLPVVLKFTPLMPAGFLILQQFLAATIDCQRTRWRDACCVTGGMAIGLLMFIFIIPSTLLGPKQNLVHLESWVTRVVTPPDPGNVNEFKIHSPKNQSFANAATLPDRYFNRTDGSVPAWIIKGVRIAFVVALLILGLGVSCRGASGRAAAFGISCGLTLMVSPLSWGHHFTLMVPAVLLTAVWLADTSRSTLAVAIGFIPPVLCWLHWLSLDTLGKLGVLGLGSAAWFAVVFVLFARTIVRTEKNPVLALDPASSCDPAKFRARAA